jgi:hypothetical protein
VLGKLLLYLPCKQEAIHMVEFPLRFAQAENCAEIETSRDKKNRRDGNNFWRLVSFKRIF